MRCDEQSSGEYAKMQLKLSKFSIYKKFFFQKFCLCLLFEAVEQNVNYQ